MTAQPSPTPTREPSFADLWLPWPHKDLSPNGRVHWARKAKATKAARYLAGVLTMGAGWQSVALPDGRLHLWIDFYPPTKRLPDDDNMLSRCKAYRDGIADALGIAPRLLAEVEQAGRRGDFLAVLTIWVAVGTA